MSITPEFIRTEVEQQSYELSLHADDERIADKLTVARLEAVLLASKVLEEYPMTHVGRVVWWWASRLTARPFTLSVDGTGLVT